MFQILRRTSTQISKLGCRTKYVPPSTAIPADRVDKTSLYDFHVKHKGKMVKFADFWLPVQYEDQSIAASHLHTRKHASLFDVSHMLQTYMKGKHAIEVLESICTADIRGLPDRNGSLSVFTNEHGGILDDFIVNKVSDGFLYVVSNAGCKWQDKFLIEEAYAYFDHYGKSDCELTFFCPSERALLALQGPEAAQVLQKLTKVDLQKQYFMTTNEAEVAGVKDCRITRCGYTGEDGFEISVPADRAVHVAEALLDDKIGNVKLAGLGARDSLRLEAGLCLYGSDIDFKTSPIEANLAWLVGKIMLQKHNALPISFQGTLWDNLWEF